ncbi:hypothetical protein L1987_21598 [Smallanthus sonchifolius]|uniref:Uncharacterized protein n=1 Tax=Smallanthus sonchifolius TaxID=185202 RepID=A0ACB9IE94_9ASTR|nr:hypothetical protein L1987_21598 [Smallanthus sonchifolius]
MVWQGMTGGFDRKWVGRPKVIRDGFCLLIKSGRVKVWVGTSYTLCTSLLREVRFGYCLNPRCREGWGENNFFITGKDGRKQSRTSTYVNCMGLHYMHFIYGLLGIRVGKKVERPAWRVNSGIKASAFGFSSPRAWFFETCMGRVISMQSTLGFAWTRNVVKTESNKGVRGTNRLFLGLKGMVWDRFIRRHKWAAGRLGPEGSLVSTTINGIYFCGINHYTFWPGRRLRKPSLEDCWLAVLEVNQDSMQPILWAILAQFGWKSDVGTGNNFNVIWKPGWGRLIMLGTIDMLRRYGKVMGRVLLTHVIRKRENWVHHFTHYGLFFRVTRCNYLWLYIVPSFWLSGNPYPFPNLYVCSDSSRELPRSRIRLQFHPFLYSLDDDYQSNVRDFWGWEGCFLTRDRCHRWNATVVM